MKIRYAMPLALCAGVLGYSHSALAVSIADADCVPTGQNCTANDAAPVLNEVQSVKINGETFNLPLANFGCTVGDSMEIAIQVNYTQNSGGQATRYDLASFVGQMGVDAVGGGAGNCSVDYLGPVTPTPPAVGPPYTGLDLVNGDGPFRNADGDSCGDIFNDDKPSTENLTLFNIGCADNNGTGTVDISYLVAWKQNAGTACNATAIGNGDSSTLLPGSPSKCLYEASSDLGITVEAEPSIVVTKTAAPTSAQTGETVTYTVGIQNTSDPTDPVTITSLTDEVNGGGETSLQGEGDCDISGPLVIAPGDTYTCQFTATYNSADTYIDVVRVVGEDNEGVGVSGNDDATVTVTSQPPPSDPGITVVKSGSPLTLDEPGGTVTYSVAVQNTGNVDGLVVTALNDDVYGDLTSTAGDIDTTNCTLNQTLDVSEIYNCQFTTTVDINGGGSVTDTITASWNIPDGQTQTTDSNEVTVTVNDLPSSISVTKTPSPSNLPVPGGEVMFTVTVDNPSVADTVTIDTLNDDIYGDITDDSGEIITTDCQVPQDIDPESEYSCSFTVNIELPQGGEHSNIVTASGMDDDDNNLEEEGGTTVTVDAPPPPPASGGKGNALIFPYYTANGGWATLFNLTNVTDNFLALKVRFREQENSRDVLDFNVVMSPQDAWTGWVADGPAGPRFFTRDLSCTSPIFPTDENGAQFVDLQSVAYSGASSDGGSTGIQRAAEGHVEVFVMGAIPDDEVTKEGTPTAYWADHKHLDCGIVDGNFRVNSGSGLLGDSAIPPSDTCYWNTCAGANDETTQNAIAGAPRARADFPYWGNLEPASAPLKGNISYINTGRGVGAGSTAQHLVGFGAGSNNNLVTAQEYPYFLEPTLGSNDGLWGWSFPLENQIVHVINEWSVNMTTGASTDWVVAFPEKYLHVDIYDDLQAGANVPRLNARGTQCSYTNGGIQCVAGTNTPEPTLLEALGPEETTAILFPYSEPFDGQSCQEVVFDLWDREENGVTSGGTSISPAPPVPASALCYETNVLTFGGAESVLDSRLAQTIDVSGLVSGAAFGWMDLQMSQAVYYVSGFAMKERDFGNPMRNYGQLMDHAFDEELEIVDPR